MGHRHAELGACCPRGWTESLGCPVCFHQHGLAGVYLLKRFQLWPSGVFLPGSCVPLTHPSVSVYVCTRVCTHGPHDFLVSWRSEMLWVILCVFWPSLRTSHFSYTPWSLVLEKPFRNQDLGAGCAWHCLGVISQRPSQLAEPRNVCMSVHVYL